MSKFENISDLYPHNKKVFLNVLNNLKTHNKVGVVQATGTGKGKLASCFVDFILYRKKDAKILIAAPLRSVLENYRDNFNITSDSVKYATYSKINNLSEIDLINIGQQYDLIVLDEYHRCGATEWFKSIQTLFNGVDKGVCKVIGLTATPIRYLDNSRDMSEELFNGNVIQGLNLEEAILDGILPGFVYNACYFGTEKVLKEVEDKLKNNDYKISDDTIRNDLMVKVKELNMIYQNRYKIENIIKDNTKELGINQKWVIFCRDKQSLGEIREFCVNWFNYKPNLYIINSDRQAEDNDRTLVEFRNAKQGVNVLLCVDMLNEGVHIKDLNGVIMLRKTDSPIIFLQQLGRSLEAGKDFKPIIFDLIGNYKGLKVKQDEIERTPISIVKGIEQKTKGKRNYVIVHNFTEELDVVLEQINKVTLDIAWTDKEIGILNKYYPIGGVNLCIEKGLQNRTGAAIQIKARHLGLHVIDKHSVWTKEEDDIILKYYSEGGAELCQKKGLSHLSENSILNRARKLGFIQFDINFWTDEEIEILNKYYSVGGWELCQQKGLVNRDARAIKWKANKLGLFQKSMWTDEEIEILRTYYPIGGVALCKEKGLENKPELSIRDKANTLKLKASSRYWTDAEVEVLKKYYSIGGWKLCQEKGLSDKTQSSIMKKAMKMGLKAEFIEMWSDEEIQILKKYYPKGGIDLCQKNGLTHKTVNSIRTKAHQFGLKMEGNVRGVWSNEEVELLKKYYPLGGSFLCIEKGLKSKTACSINQKASKLGLQVDMTLPKWSNEELKILKKYYPIGGTNLCIEKGINRSHESIYRMAKKYSIVYSKNSSWSERENLILLEFYPLGGYKLCQEKGLERTREAIKSRAKILGIKCNK